MGAGGFGNRAAAQRQADEIRANPGVAERWDRGMWIRLVLAAVPLVAIVVAAFTLR